MQAPNQQLFTLNDKLYAANSALGQANDELGDANEELGDTNQQLTSTTVDLDTFVYTASHDLRAPITNIEGLLQALLEELPPAHQVGNAAYILCLMHDSVNRLKLTIDHLTTVARLQKERGQPELPIDVATVIRDVLLDLAPYWQKQAVVSTWTCEPAPSWHFPKKTCARWCTTCSATP